MKIKRRFKTGKPLIEIIPLIDVLFQILLVFFLVTSYSQLPGVNLALPGSESVQTAQKILVNLDANDQLWMHSQKMTFEQLEQVLNTYPLAMSERQTAAVVLTLDARVPSSKAVMLLDVFRRTGFYDVSVQTTGE